MLPSKRAIGTRGEELARQYLEQQGMTFITANWLCKTGEIDLIMQDSDTRVFVEVRLRAPTSFGLGFETVAWQKQRKLIRTAKFYQQTHRYWGDIRFDVISIVDQPGKEPVIEHIPYAFEAAA